MRAALALLAVGILGLSSVTRDGAEAVLAPPGIRVYHGIRDVALASKTRIPIHLQASSAQVRAYLYGDQIGQTVVEHRHGDHRHDLIGYNYNPGYYLDLAAAGAQNGYAPDFIRPSSVGSGVAPVPVASVLSGLRVWIDGADQTGPLGGPWGAGAPFATGQLVLDPFLSGAGEHSIEIEVTGSGGTLTYDIYVR